MEHSIYVCSCCGKDLTEIYKEHNTDRMPCPDCGSTKRNIICTIEGTVKCFPSVSLKGKDIAGYTKYESRQRYDVSEKTGKPVKVSVDVEKTDPNKTVVTHKVEEIDKLTGYTQTIHEDTKIGEARHRPKKE